MTTPQSTNQSPQSANDRWEYVETLRPDLAAELERLATNDRSNTADHLRTVARWFRDSADENAALSRPDVLAICLPLLNWRNSQPPTKNDVPCLVQCGMESLNQQPSAGKRMFRLFRYPLLLSLLTMLLWVAFSVWAAPKFESSFRQFGFELPTLMKAMLGSATWTRRGLILAPILCLIVPVAWRRVAALDRMQPANAKWLDRKAMSSRSAVANWTWHVALLLEAGLPRTQAVRLAGRVSAKHWMKNRTANWDFDRWDGQPSMHQHVFPEPTYHLVNRTLLLPDSEGKNVMLQQAAKYYWDRDRSIGDWWLQLLATLMLWNFGILILICYIAFYVTTFSLINGLLSW